VSADHRKPFLAFVVLALLAAALVGVQRADAQSGRFLAAAIGTTVRVQGTLPGSELSLDVARDRLASLSPAFATLTGHTPALVRPLVRKGEAAVAEHVDRVEPLRSGRASTSSSDQRRGRPAAEHGRPGAHALAEAVRHGREGVEGLRTRGRAALHSARKAVSVKSRHAWSRPSEHARAGLRRALERAGRRFR
jgi:hypothetical protein